MSRVGAGGLPKVSNLAHESSNFGADGDVIILQWSGAAGDVINQQAGATIYKQAGAVRDANYQQAGAEEDRLAIASINIGRPQVHWDPCGGIEEVNLGC